MVSIPPPPATSQWRRLHHPDFKFPSGIALQTQLFHSTPLLLLLLSKSGIRFRKSTVEINRVHSLLHLLTRWCRNIIKRILDPNPTTRITMAGIKAYEWFKQGYNPECPHDDEEDIHIDDDAFSMQDAPRERSRSLDLPTLINAFQLIRMSSCLDLSGFFEKKDVSKRKISFTSNHSAKDLIEKIEDIVTEMGFGVQKKNGRLKVIQEHKGHKYVGSLSVATEVFEISPSLYVVELRKSYGDASV